MIRINLVAPEKPAHQKKRASSSAPSSPGAIQFYVFMFLFVGGALGACGLGWWWQAHQISIVNQETEAAQKRKAQLQVIKEQVDALEAKRRMFHDKVATIERLHLEQRGPVHLLDEISKALPELVWLTGIDEAASGGAIKIDGKSSGLSAVADFMTNLQRSGWFPQVDMGPTKESKEGGAVVDFSLTAHFKDPEVAKREAEDAKERAARATTDAQTPAKPGARPVAPRGGR